MAKSKNELKTRARAMADDNRYIYGSWNSDQGNGRYRKGVLMYDASTPRNGVFGRDCCMAISQLLYECMGWDYNNWPHGYFWPHPSEAGYNSFLVNTLDAKKYTYNQLGGYNGLKDMDILIGGSHTYMIYDHQNKQIFEANDGYGGYGAKSVDVHSWIKYGENPEVYRLPWSDDIAPTKNYAYGKITELWSCKKGDNGGHVITLQSLLKTKFNCYNGDIDGDFGNMTDTSVKCFQKNAGLYVDGVCGQQTWYTLLCSNVVEK